MTNNFNMLYCDGFKSKEKTGFLVCDGLGNILSDSTLTSDKVKDMNTSRIGKKRDSFEAELYALLSAMELVKAKGIVYSDCEPAVKIIKGTFKLRKDTTTLKQLQNEEMKRLKCYELNKIQKAVVLKQFKSIKHNAKVKHQNLDVLIKGCRALMYRKNIQIEYINRSKNIAGQIVEKKFSNP